MKLTSNPRRDKGWLLIAPYKYAVPLKNGQWTVYEGGWSDSGEDNIAGLTVSRDWFNNKPMRFNTFDEVQQIYGKY